MLFRVKTYLSNKRVLLLYIAGLILDIYWVRYLHAMPSLSFFWYFHTSESLQIHAA